MVYYDGVVCVQVKTSKPTNYVTMYNLAKIVIELIRVLTNWSNK